MSARYVIGSVTGYTIGPMGARSTHLLRTSYHVMDTWYGYAVVAQYAPGIGRRTSEKYCRDRAERECVRLNAEHEAWMRRVAS